MILGSFAHAINTVGAISLMWAISVPVTAGIICFTILRLHRPRRGGPRLLRRP